MATVEEELIGDEESSDESMSGNKESTNNTNNNNAADDVDVEMKDAQEGESNQEPPASAASDAKNDKDEDNDVDDDDNAKNDKEKKDEATTTTTTSDNPATKEKKQTESDPFAEEDSDDEDVGTTSKKKDSENSPEKKPKEKEDQDDLADSDDDDDGDVEFDDKDAITGDSHKKGFQRKSSNNKKSAVDKMREAEEADEARDTADADDDDDDNVKAKENSQHKKTPKLDPRTMVVMEPERPSSQCNLYVSKLPQVVGIQPQAFDPATYSAKVEEEEYQGFVNDMIRWRYKKDDNGNMMRDDEGKLIRESNARLVQWEDGSFTLHVGKEAFEVDNVDSSRTIGQMDVLTGRVAKFAGLNGYLYLSQIATYREPNEEGEDEKETPAGTVLECMGAVASRMTARPSSLISEAHKSLTVAVRQKTIKRAKIAEMVTQFDPEKEKAERIKDKEALAKERSRKSSYGDGQRSRASRRPGVNKAFHEDDGDYDTIGLGSLKKRTMNADDEDMDDYGDDYDDADDDEAETFNRGKRPKKRAANRKSLDSDEENDDEEKAASGGKEADEDDDDDDDEVITPIKTKKRTQQTVFDDDDSD